MASMAQLHFSPLLHRTNDVGTFSSRSNFNEIKPQNLRSSPSLRSMHPKFPISCSGGNGGNGTGDGGGGDGDGDGDQSDDSSSPWKGFGVLGLFLCGWRSRVAADPQFPFKVLMEELVGVTANVAGDMASRPNFGLGELDFVFSTLIVGSILNFTLMYILAPTSGAGAATISAGSPSRHIFEPGSFSLLGRAGPFAYEGAVLAAVGFAGGLVGTAVTNGLVAARKRIEPGFDSPNKPPPTILNALTWAVHMGISANLRYQALNGVEFVLAKALSPVAFKGSVVGLRCVNNLLGGVTFVALARLTGSQSKNVDVEVGEDKKGV